MSERKRYIVGVVKIPFAERDLAHQIITAEDNRDFLDIIGALDDDPNFPIGSNATYALDLTDEEVERVRNASNVRYVELDQELTTDANNVTYDGIPSDQSMKFMEADFRGVEDWHGKDVTVAILDGGTSAPVRNYMKWTLVDRKEYQSDPTGPDEVTSDHGCLVAPNGVPYGGRIMDLVIANDNGSAATSNSQAAMRYAVDNGVKVINYSYSNAGGVDGASQSWVDTFTYLATKNVMVFCSAGNDGGAFLNYPSKYSETYSFVHSSISFSTETSTRASSSNHLASGSGCAPGVNVISLDTVGNVLKWSGTSASTPHMCSLAARALTGGRFTTQQVSAALKANTRDTGQPASEQGGGAYSLFKTLTALGAFSGTSGQLTNLSTNPAGKTATTGWTAGNSGQRVTGLSGMSRTTGFGSFDSITTPKAACVVGQPFTHTLDVVSDTTETLTAELRWFNAAGSQIGTAATATFSATANVPQRITRTGTAPASAATASIYVSKPAAGSPTGTVTSRWVGISDSTTLRIKIKSATATAISVQVSANSDLSGTKFTSNSIAPDADGYTQHNISGLTPGTQYYYRVILNAGPAPGIFKAKTAPTGATSFSFGFGSCTNASDSDAFTSLLTRNPDLFCHLGDNFYADGGATTVANYKTQLGAKVSAAKQGALLSNVPSSYTWSDHDFGFEGNAVGTASPTVTGNANSAYRGVVPTPTLPASGIYYSWNWGRVKFIQLDERTFKDANNKADTLVDGGGGDPPPPPPPPVGTTYPMEIMEDYWYVTTPEASPWKASTWNIYKDSGPVELEGEEPPGPQNPDLDTFIRDTTSGACNPPGGVSGVPVANPKRLFKLNAAKDGIIMACDYEGATTANSPNVRTEFREMTSDGLTNAKWSTASGSHKMMVVTQVDRLDGNHMVVAQIHGASDDLTVFRLEGTTLWRSAGDTAHGAQIATGVTLGMPFAIGFHTQGNNTDYYYSNAANVKTMTWEQFFVSGNKKNSYTASDSGCYFKAGAYMQKKGSAGSWGQVTLFKAIVQHSTTGNESEGDVDLNYSDAVGPPWTKNYPDGSGYPVITGGTTSGSAANAAALSSIANGASLTYTGSTITSAFTISGKSNITIKNLKMGQGGALTLSGCSNVILDNVDAQYDPSGTTPIIFVRGAYNKVKVQNSLFGSTTTAGGGGAKSRFIMFGDDASAGSSFGMVERCTFRNKNNPGNTVHTAGNGDSSTGGVRYTLITHCLIQGTKPFDENDHESCLMGLSDFQLTNGQQIIEHCRFEDCWSEPEVISMKMNFSYIRGCTFVECCGSASLRHGDDGMVHDSWFYGDKDIQGPQTYNRTSAGPRLYGARHKIFRNTIRVNGNGGSRPSATSLYEAPITLDSGDVAPGSTSTGHANVVNALVENNLLVNCGNPIMVTDNYGTAPTGTVRNNKIVACANSVADGVGTYGSSPSKAGLTITGNAVFSTVAAAGLTVGANGEHFDPSGAAGARVNFLTASMVGKGSTYDAWTATHTGTGTGGGGGGGGGGAPVVNAGADASVVVNTPFTRQASETGTGITARQWVVTSGPSQVNATISTAQDVNWTPTVAGGYTLAYTATNATGPGTDTVAVTVTTGGVVETGSIPNKTILGAVQRQWLKDQITLASEPLIVVVGDTVWQGPAVSDADLYTAYDKERQNIASFITASGKNVIRLCGDMHSVGFANPGIGYKRVYQAAPFNNTGSVKGGDHTITYPTADSGSNFQQYGFVTVTDNSSTMSVDFRGYSADGTLRVNDTYSFNTPTASPVTPPVTQANSALKVTGHLAEAGSSAHTYFDGDSTGGQWLGANGNSTSTIGGALQAYRLNLCSNPSFETATTGYSVASVRSGITVAALGRAQSIPPNQGSWYLSANVTGNGSTSASPDFELVCPDAVVSQGLTYYFSAAVRHQVFDTELEWAIEWRTATGTISTTSGGREACMANEWDRCWITATAPSGATIARPKLRAFNHTLNTAQSFRVDGVHYELAGDRVQYFDGTFVGATWSGTAHVSTSYLGTPSGGGGGGGGEDPPPAGNFLYRKTYEGFLDGSLDWDTATIKAALVRGYTKGDHKFLSEVTSNGGVIVATTGGFTGKTVTNGVANASSASFGTVAAGAAVPAVVIYQSSGPAGGSDVAASAQRLIAYLDTGTNFPITPNGGTITIAFPGLIFTL